jgi:hypothetical protein
MTDRMINHSRAPSSHDLSGDWLAASRYLSSDASFARVRRHLGENFQERKRDMSGAPEMRPSHLVAGARFELATFGL